MAVALKDYYVGELSVLSIAVPVGDVDNMKRIAIRGAQRGALETRSAYAPTASKVSEDSIVWEFAGAWERVLMLIPPITKTGFFLRWSIVPILAFAFLLPVMISNTITGISPSVMLGSWVGPIQIARIDPVILHLLVMIVIVVLLIRIARHSGAPWTWSGVAAITMIAAAMVFEFILDRVFMKPAIGIARPQGFSVASEPFVFRFIHSVFGAGGDFPSGAVARQVVLVCLLIWISSDPRANLGRRMLGKVMIFSLYTMALFTVLVVGFLRFYVGAHSVESLSVGVSSGILEFWVLVIGFGAIVNRPARELLPELTRIWVIVMIGWLVLATQKALIGGMIVMIAVGLPALSAYLTARDRNKARRLCSVRRENEVFRSRA